MFSLPLVCFPASFQNELGLGAGCFNTWCGGGDGDGEGGAHMKERNEKEVCYTTVGFIPVQKDSLIRYWKHDLMLEM